MIRISNIHELIQSYKDDLINDNILIEILQKQTPHLAIWIDGVQGYNYSRQQTLQGLHELKKYMEAGHKYPIFFPLIAATSSGFCFNNTLNNDKDL